MGEHTRMGGRPHDGRTGSLGELIHAAVRRAIEVAVDEELTAALGVTRLRTRRQPVRLSQRHEATDADGADRPAGPHDPRATLFTAPARGNGPRRCCPATSAGCGKSMRPWSRPTWPAATPGGSAGPWPVLKAAPALEERRLADRRDAQGRARGLAHPVAGRARRPRAVSRCPRAAGPERREGRERPGPGRRRGPHRRPEAAPGPGALPRRRDLRGLEGLSRRSGHARARSAPVVRDRRTPGPAEGRRPRVAPGPGPALLCPQTAQP